MRMLRVALVLIVLAAFVAATVAVSMAATVTPTAKPTAKATVKPLGTSKPIKSTGKMIDLQQMKSTIGDVYKKLKASVKMPTAPAMPGKATVTGTANKTTAGKNATMPAKYSPSMGLTTPPLKSIQAPAIMDQLGAMPKISSVNKPSVTAPGMDHLTGMSF